MRVAVDDTGDEQVESSVDEVTVAAGDADNPDAADFNVTIKDKIVYDKDARVVTFDWPQYVKEFDENMVPQQYNNNIVVSVESGSNIQIYKYPGGGANSVFVSFGSLYIFPSITTSI